MLSSRKCPRSRYDIAGCELAFGTWLAITPRTKRRCREKPLQCCRRPRSPKIPFSRRKQSEFETSFAVVNSRMHASVVFPQGYSLDTPCGFQPASLPESCAPGSWVIGANMQCKRFVALQLEVAHHFIERFAGGRTRGFEPPATFGATKTLKTLFLNPYQLPAHCRICSCAPRTRLLSKDETFWFAIDGSFRSGVLPDCITLNFIGISTLLRTQESA